MCIDVEGDTDYLSNLIGRYKALSCKKTLAMIYFQERKDKITSNTFKFS